MAEYGQCSGISSVSLALIRVGGVVAKWWLSGGVVVVLWWLRGGKGATLGRGVPSVNYNSPLNAAPNTAFFITASSDSFCW